MANTKSELCGVCCRDSHPIRKSFCESIVCACGAPFFSQTVVENNLPTNRRCLIEIPMEFMEDHGSRFDKTVTLQEKEASEVHRVKIGGNLFVGFGFEWRDFAESHNIGIGQVIVFTLVARSRFLVQVYKLGNPSSIAPKPQTPTNAEVEQARTVPPPITPKVEDDDDIEVCVAHDWLVAKASRTNTTKPILPSKVKVEKVFSETSNGPAIRTPDINVNERQKRTMVPNDLEGMDVSDDIVEASDSSRRKKKFDSEIIHEGHSLRGTTRQALRYERPVLKTPAQDQGGQASPEAPTRESTSDNEENSDSEENGDSDASSSSTSDSAWSPGKSHSHHGRKRTAANHAAYSDSNTEDEDEDEDGEDGMEGDQVLNKIAGKKRSFADRSSSLDEIKRKRGKPSMRNKSKTDPASTDDGVNETRTGLLVEGCIVKRHGHDWHEPGTQRGRTYVSKRRPVTEAEKVKTLEKAKQVQVNYPSFLKQLHKDCCYRSVKFFAPTKFYKESMVSLTKGSYRATLIDEEGKSWPTNIRGMCIFWKNFTLDHYLEEDDVVVFALIDPRPESITYLVHIFRVVDVKVTLTGKAGWAVHYDVVEGTKKQYFEERRRLARAQRLKKLQKQKRKQKRKDGPSRRGMHPILPVWINWRTSVDLLGGDQQRGTEVEK